MTKTLIELAEEHGVVPLGVFTGSHLKAFAAALRAQDAEGVEPTKFYRSTGTDGKSESGWVSIDCAEELSEVEALVAAGDLGNGRHYEIATFYTAPPNHAALAAECAKLKERVAELERHWRERATECEELSEDVGRLRQQLATARAEAIKSERRAIEFGDLLHKQILALRAAVVAAHLEGPETGMEWIENTLAGPDHLPDIDAARNIGGAQALFDSEIAEHEAFRAAHPAPALSDADGGEVNRGNG